jgi:recombination protein RecA
MSALRDRLAKRYGDRVVRRETVQRYEVISTGSLTLDAAHRTGGYVEGRMHEIVGPEGVGKTTTAIAGMVEAQRKYPDKAVGYIDMEQTFDYAWAEALGLQTDDDHWLHLYPDDSEDVSDMLAQQAETGLFSMIVVDSIGGMESKEAFEKEAGDKVMGRNAQVITRMVKRCAVLCRRNKVTAILINQHRANLSNPQGMDESAGPKALKYSTTTKTVMSHGGGEPIRYRLPGDEEDTIIGRQVRARVVRSKVAVQGKKAEYYIINADTDEYGTVGIDKVDEAILVGVLHDVIEQRGAWYYLPRPDGGDPHRFQGKEKVGAHLRACPDDLEFIRSEVLAILSGDVREEMDVEFEHEVASA